MKKIIGIVVTMIALCTLFCASCESTGNVVSEAGFPPLPKGYVTLNGLFEKLPSGGESEKIYVYIPFSYENTLKSLVVYQGGSWQPYNKFGDEFKYGPTICSLDASGNVTLEDVIKNGIRKVVGKKNKYVALDVAKIMPECFKDDDVAFEALCSNFWHYFTSSFNYSDPVVNGCYSRHIIPNKKIKSLENAKISSSIYKNDSFAYSLNKNGNITLEAYIGKPVEALVIPNEIDGLPVETINSMASFSTFKSVLIPQNVTVIGEWAFNGSGIETLVFAKNSKCTKILEEAFSDNHLKELPLLPKGISVGSKAFARNEIKKATLQPTWVSNIVESDELEEVFFEDGCVLITNNSFENCKNLKKISLPSSVKEIARKAFYNCTSLSEIEFRGKSFKFEQRNHFITDDYAFYNCPLPLKTKSFLLQSGMSNAAFN